MYHCGDELNLLRHTLREFLDFLVPPALDTEFHEPLLELGHRITVAHSLELGEIHCLLAHLHLAVKTALFRQITYLLDIVLGYRTAVKTYCSRIWNRDAVDYSDKSGLAGSVRAKQTEDLSFGDLNRHIVKSHFLTEALADILAFDYSHCVCFISSTV